MGNHSLASSLVRIHVFAIAPAGFLQPAPLVAGEGGANWEVLEDGMPADEVHPKRQVIGPHPFQFRSAGTRPALQLPDTSLLRRT